MIEILRRSQQAAIQLSRRGGESLTPTTQKTIMTMHFEIYALVFVVAVVVVVIISLTLLLSAHMANIGGDIVFITGNMHTGAECLVCRRAAGGDGGRQSELITPGAVAPPSGSKGRNLY